MSKITCLLLFVVAASLTKVSALSDDEKAVFHEALAPIIAECSAKHEVSEEEVKAAKEAKSAEGIKPCFIGCILKKVEFLDDKGIYVPEKGLAKLKKFVQSEEEFAQFEEIGKKCLKVNDASVSDGDAGCDRAKLVLACAMDSNAYLPL